MKILKFLTLLWGIIETLAECPKLNSFPVMYDKERFLCAIRYTGIGSEYPIEGCNACDDDNEEGYKTADDFNADAGIGHYYNLGSAIVRPGCHLYLYRVSMKLSTPLHFLNEFLIMHFQEEDFGGPIDILDAGIHSNLEGPIHGNKCSGWRGIKCRCDMDPPVCDPTDSYGTVVQCDNSLSVEITECNYIKVRLQ